jgi:hypothetical protein
MDGSLYEFLKTMRIPTFEVRLMVLQRQNEKLVTTYRNTTRRLVERSREESELWEAEYKRNE